jgi:hypothetical protein
LQTYTYSIVSKAESAHLQITEFHIKEFAAMWLEVPSWE